MIRLLVFPVLALGAVPAGLAAPAARGATPGLHLVIAPPWRDADALIAAAGGQTVGPLTAPFGRFAASVTPDFAARAKGLGLLVLDGGRVALLCGERP